MVKRAYILAVLLVTMFAPAALAQTAATLSGTVHDPSNAVLPGVAVTARSGETGLARTSVTGPEGRFVIPQLAPGVYEIRAELAGFKPHVRPEVRLAVAQSLVLNITLQIGDLAIVDVVTAEIPTINTATSELSYLVTSEQIEQIPLNGRNYTDLALLQPGVNSCGQINVLTKWGTNRLSGSAFEYHRNDAMDAKNYFDNNGKPNFQRNQFGFTAGGPIRTDKAFFFLGYEALIERLGRTIST